MLKASEIIEAVQLYKELEQHFRKEHGAEIKARLLIPESISQAEPNAKLQDAFDRGRKDKQYDIDRVLKSF